MKFDKKEYHKNYYRKNREKLRAYAKLRHEKNREKKHAYDKQYREKNREKINARKRQYLEEHPEKKRILHERSKLYREKNREKLIAKRKIYLEKNREKTNAQQKLYRDKNPEKFSVYRKRVYEKNRERLLAQMKQYNEKNRERDRERIRAYSKRYRERKKYELSPLPSRPGHPRLKRPGREELVELYVVQGLSMRDTAKKLRMKKDTIQRTLVEYRIKRRASFKRSRLDKVNPERLYSELAEKGLKRTAERFGVTKRTLQYFLARKRRESERKASPRTLNASARSVHKTPRKEREA